MLLDKLNGKEKTVLTVKIKMAVNRNDVDINVELRRARVFFFMVGLFLPMKTHLITAYH